MVGASSEKTLSISTQEMMAVKDDAWRAKQSHILVLASILSSTQFLITRQTDMSIFLWIRAGDSIAVGNTMSRINSLAALMGVIVSPTLGRLSDSIGRKKALCGIACTSILARLLQIRKQTLTSMTVSGVLQYLMFSMASQIEGTACADLYKHNGAQMSQLQGRLLMCPALCSLFIPIVGGYLGTRHLLYPYCISAALNALLVLLLRFSFQDTLAKKDMCKFQFAAAVNPLAFTKLFRTSRAMAWLVTIKTSAELVHAKTLFQMGEMFRAQALGFDMMQRAHWVTFTAAVVLPGYAFSTRIVELLGGAKRAVLIGLSIDVLRNLCVARSRNARMQFALSLPNLVTRCSETVLSGMLVREAERCSVPQGQLKGELGSLQTAVGVIAPLFWARIYVSGASQGMHGRMYEVVASVTALQLLQVACLGTVHPHVHDEQ